jgi:phage tail-like protein
MTDGLTYRFETPDQRQACLHMTLPEEFRLRSDAGREVARLNGPIEAFAVGTDGAFVWVGPDNALYLDQACAGSRLGLVRRLVFGRRRIWALGEDGIARLDGGSLQLLEAIAGKGVVDIADDRADGLWVLTDAEIVHLDPEGRRRGAPLPLDGPADQLAAAGDTLALLELGANRLTVRRGNASIEIDLATILGRDGPQFLALGLAAGGQAILLAGEWDGSPGFLLLDPAGEPSAWGRWMDGVPEALALAKGDLIAVFGEGGHSVVRHFGGAAEAGGLLWLTPVLESDTLAGDWLRADVRAALSEGATLTLRFAASRDEGLRTVADAIFADTSRLVGERVRALGNLLDWSDKKRTYVGEAREGGAPVEDFPFPLHEVDGHFLWLEITLDHNLANPPARLETLVVSHDAPSLMDNLPAIYRGPDGDYDGTLRRLVAILEATSQGIDERIAGVAGRLDPRRAEARWLPALAGLLGLPFDGALSTAMQRSLVQAAPAILTGRGTLNGVRALLDALFGKRPFRIVDRTEQLIPIALGGGSFVGSRLPAYLSGPSRRIPRLNARLVLGKTPLCPVDPGASMSVERPPELLVVIPARGRERRRYGAAVRQMIEAMLPAGVRLRLRWTGLTRAGPGGELLATVAGADPLMLGAGPALGQARVGGDLDFRLREDGVPAVRRLQ